MKSMTGCLAPMGDERLCCALSNKPEEVFIFLACLFVCVLRSERRIYVSISAFLSDTPAAQACSATSF